MDQIALATQLCKAKWNHFKQVLHIIIFAGGQVFGGCPRDMVYRRYHDKSYMEYCKKQHADQTDVNAFYNTYYNDLTVHPESAEGRNLVPADIDCFFRNQGMRDEALECLEFLGLVREYDTMGSNGMASHGMGSNGMGSNGMASHGIGYNGKKLSGYLIQKHPELKDYIHQQTYKIKLSMRKGTKWFLRSILGDEIVKTMLGQTVKVDVLTYIGPPLVFLHGGLSMYAPPFHLDQDVNVNQLSMIYNRHGGSSDDCFEIVLTKWSDNTDMTLDKIKEAILLKKAVACESVCDSHRIKKMVKKGYTIHFTPPFGRSVPHTDGDQCVICLAAIELTDDHGPFQPCVCTAKYHLACFAECFLSLSEENRLRCQYCRADLQCFGHQCDFWKQIGLYTSARQRYLGQPVGALVHNNCMRCTEEMEDVD